MVALPKKPAAEAEDMIWPILQIAHC